MELCQTKDNPAITRFESVSCEPNLRLFILKPQRGNASIMCCDESLGSPILGDGLMVKHRKLTDLFARYSIGI